MASLAFDTLQFVRKLTTAGVLQQQADASWKLALPATLRVPFSHQRGD